MYWQNRSLESGGNNILEVDFAACKSKLGKQAGVMGACVLSDSNRHIIPVMISREMNNENKNTWKALYNDVLDDPKTVVFTDGAKGEPAAQAETFKNAHKFQDARHLTENFMKAGHIKETRFLKAAMNARTQGDLDAALKTCPERLLSIYQEGVINRSYFKLLALRILEGTLEATASSRLMPGL